MSNASAKMKDGEKTAAPVCSAAVGGVCFPDTVPLSSSAGCALPALFSSFTAASSSSSSPVACRSRHTLASTAAMFLPDKSSPILLAPSESEIMSDPQYYEFGSKLVAGQILFFLAFAMSYVILGWYRRREMRAKRKVKEQLKEKQELAQAIRRRTDIITTKLTIVKPIDESRIGNGSGRLRSKPSPFILPIAPFSLELTDMTRPPTLLQRIHARIQSIIYWIIFLPARCRRRRRTQRAIQEQQRQIKKQQQRRSSLNGTLAGKNHPPPHPPNELRTKINEAAASTVSYLSRILPHKSSTSSNNSSATSSSSPFSSPSPPPSSLSDAVRQRVLVEDLLDPFCVPLPWLQPDEHPFVLSPPALSAEENAAVAIMQDEQKRERSASITNRPHHTNPLAAKRFSISNFLQKQTSNLRSAFGGMSEGNANSNAAIVNGVNNSGILARDQKQEASTNTRNPQLHLASPNNIYNNRLRTFAPSLCLSASPAPPTAASFSSSSHPSSSSFSDDSSNPSSPTSSSSSLSFADLLNNGHDDFPDVENEREFLTYTLATFVLCISLVWLELLVLSVLASDNNGNRSKFSSSSDDLFIPLNQYYVFKWCSKELVTVLWTGTVWLSSISLFILAPFAYLYYEAEGIGGRKGIMSRVAETLLVLSFLTILLYGSFLFLNAILNPFSPLVSVSSAASSSSSSFLLSFWSGYEDLLFLSHWWDMLFENLYHFLPGLLLLLGSAHPGFISLIAMAYKLHVPFDSFTNTMKIDTHPNGKIQQQLNAIKIEISTIERQWKETEGILQQSIAAKQEKHRQHLFPISSRTSVSRAIQPSNNRHHILSKSAILNLTHLQHSRVQRLHQLHAEHDTTRKQLQPLSLTMRIWTTPAVRNTVSVILTLTAMLLTWHIILRVAQREARLIFRGSIFRWFSNDADMLIQGGVGSNNYHYNSNPDIISSNDEHIWQMFVKTIWWILYSLKSLLGTLLSILTGRGLGKPSSPPSSSTVPLSSGPLFDFPFLDGVVEFFRVLLHVFLGLNGFKHPFSAFLADIAVVAFFLLASAHSIFMSPILHNFSPINMLMNAMNKEKNGATTAAVTDVNQDSATLLLFSAQFFTVNTALCLLLTSALPIAGWMLGLTSFDLFDFYPESSEQLINSSTGGASIFIHAYNLAFLALTAWHVTRISKQLLLWVIFQQIVRNIEVLVESIRIRLGWSTPNAKPEDKFQLFRRCRNMVRTAQYNNGGIPMSNFQIMKYFTKQFVRWLYLTLVPVGNVLWQTIRVSLMLVTLLLLFIFRVVTDFLKAELRDDDEYVTRPLIPTPANDLAMAAREWVKQEEERKDAQSQITNNSTVVQNESSITAQLLAEVEQLNPSSSLPEHPSSPDSLLAASSSQLHTPRRSKSKAASMNVSSFGRSLSAPPSALILDSDEESEDDAENNEGNQHDSDHYDSADELKVVDPDDDGNAASTPQNPTTSRFVLHSPLFHSQIVSARALSASFLTPGVVPSTARRLSVSADFSDNQMRISNSVSSRTSTPRERALSFQLFFNDDQHQLHDDSFNSLDHTHSSISSIEEQDETDTSIASATVSQPSTPMFTPTFSPIPTSSFDQSSPLSSSSFDDSSALPQLTLPSPAIQSRSIAAISASDFMNATMSDGDRSAALDENSSGKSSVAETYQQSPPLTPLPSSVSTSDESASE